MHNVGELLRQDWRVLRQNWRTRNLLWMTLAAAALALLAGRLNFLGQLLIFMPLLWGGTSLFFADDCGLNTLRAVQPLRRGQTVRARYAFVLLMHQFIGLALGLPLCIWLALWGKGWHRGNPMGALILMILLLLLSTALEGIRMPLYYKWGYNRLNRLSQLYVLALPTAVFLLQRVWLAAWLRLDGGEEGFAGTPLDFWMAYWNDTREYTPQNLRLWLTLALLVVTAWLTLMLLSYKMSVRIYQKREF